MGWVFIAIICASWAFAGFAHTSAPVEVTGVLGIAIGASLAAVWWHGRHAGRASAFAAAYASAEARASAAATAGASASNQVQIVFADGARAQGAAVSGLDSAEWIGGPVPVLEQEAGEMYAEELLGSQVSEQQDV